MVASFHTDYPQPNLYVQVKRLGQFHVVCSFNVGAIPTDRTKTKLLKIIKTDILLNVREKGSKEYYVTNY